jgi:hypothetical protein
MRFVKEDLDNLTEEQKDKLDCHQVTKSRYCYTGERQFHIEASDFEKWSHQEVLPSDKAFKHVRYFQGHYRNDQAWERPSVYHYVGEVEFYSVTTYCDKRTKVALRATGNTKRPVIHYRYQNRQGETEAIGEACLGIICIQVKEENKTRWICRENTPPGEVYRDPYLDLSDTGDSDTDLETDEESLNEVHRVVVELESDTDSEDFQYLVDQVPTDNPVISLPGSRAPSVIGVLQLVTEQEENTGVKRQRFDVSDAYHQEPL